jgi:hypothetical protein
MHSTGSASLNYILDYVDDVLHPVSMQPCSLMDARRLHGEFSADLASMLGSSELE